MSPKHGYESDHESATVGRLIQLGYGYEHGTNLDRDPKDVVLRARLRANLVKRYPHYPEAVIQRAIVLLCDPEGVDTLRRNRFFHVERLCRGFEVTLDLPGASGDERPTFHVHPVDWVHPTDNDFLVVNQFAVSGSNDRRLDIVVFVNGLPLVVFELKNPWDPSPTVDDAHNQIQHYSVELPRLFELNAFCVVSDGNSALHGMWSSGLEWYAPWKSADGVTIEPGRKGPMQTLINGLFPKERLLDYVRNFIVFEADKDKLVKKGAKYHQFFAVRVAVARTLNAFQAQGDKRLGVIWHTTGSGKTLSMAFLVGILRRLPELDNPTFVIQVDRNDLDDQLFDQFVRARHLVGDVTQAESVDELRKALQSSGGEVVCTTIEKFALRRDVKGKPVELTHPVLTTRSNVIVIADEAHRSQYGFEEGYARFLAEALPNARRLGFTGTPISLHGADTQAVFGDLLHTYDIRQAQDDGATVPIWYAARQSRLHLTKGPIDALLAEAAKKAGVVGDDLEKRKRAWSTMAALAGAKDRVEIVAADILEHFTDRTANLAGKAMVVCMTRENCVRMFDALNDLPGHPEIKVVMTGDLGADPKEWNEAGHLTTKAQREGIKARLIDPDDPLKMVIVCDLWLTGTDIPCLHTLYVDKPMQGHNIVQAISRVNRVFGDKKHGLIVDYIGIGDDLRDATAKYTAGGGEGNPAPDVTTEGVPLFFEALEAIHETVPNGHDYAAWRRLNAVALEDLRMGVCGWLAEEKPREDAFLLAEARLTHAFLLVKQVDTCRVHADEVIFYQDIRRQVRKWKPGKKTAQRAFDQTVRDLVDEHVETEGVSDVFKMAGITTPDVSILDDTFLQDFKDKPHEDLRLKLLMRLIDDEVRAYACRNSVKAKSFRQMLEEALERYHQRLVDAAKVVETMLAVKKEIDASAARAKLLNLSEEELAFYDAVLQHAANVYDQPFLAGLVRDVVTTIKGHLAVDWTEPHREDVKAAVRTAVRRTLRRRGVKEADFDALLGDVMGQAEARWSEWPVGA